jgi:hypothetical protein
MGRVQGTRSHFEQARFMSVLVRAPGSFLDQVGPPAHPNLLSFVYCAGSRSSSPRGQSGPTGMSSNVIIPA